MKRGRIVLLIFSVFFAGAVVAQSSPGSLFVGGSFNFSTGSDKVKTSTTTATGPSTLVFQISPKVGYFMSENLAVGAGIGFSTSRRESVLFAGGVTSNVINNTSSFEIAPFARYYMGNDNFGLFGEGIISLGFGRSSRTEGNTTTEGNPINSLRIGVSPGVYYFISENFAIEAQFGFLGLNRRVEKSGQGHTVRAINNNFGLNLNLNDISFGIMYRF